MGSEARTIADVLYPKVNPDSSQKEGTDEFFNKIIRSQDITAKVRKRVMDEHAKRLKRQNAGIRFEEGGEGMVVYATILERAFEEVAC